MCVAGEVGTVSEFALPRRMEVQLDISGSKCLCAYKALAGVPMLESAGEAAGGSQRNLGPGLGHCN